MLKLYMKNLVLLMCQISMAGIPVGKSFAQTQPDRLVTLDAERLPLRHVLQIVGEQAGVNFIYEDDLVSGVFVTIRLDRVGVNKALEAVLNHTDLTYRRISDNHIVVIRTTQSNLLSGRVIDAETRDPLPMASVFIANTTIGTMTTDTGSFRLKNIPPGAYTFVITYIGYDIRKIPIQLSGSDSLVLSINLKPQPIVSKDLIEVSAERSKNSLIMPGMVNQWQREFNRFKEVFLGVSQNAKACRILNPKALRFYHENKDNLFEAFADTAIQVENRALGYRLSILLESFRSTDYTIEYRIYPRFEELEPGNREEQMQWDKNRQKAYTGSIKHFLTALVQDRLDEERFAVMHTQTLSSKLKVSQHIGTMGDFGTTYSSADVISGRFKPENVLTPESSGLIRLQFTNYLLIKRGIDEYASIKLNTPYVLIDKLGNMHTPESFTKYGVWWADRIGDLLPEDYTPQ